MRPERFCDGLRGYVVSNLVVGAIHNNYAVAFSGHAYYDVWVQRFEGVQDTDNYMDVKLLGEVTHLLQMRMNRQHGRICNDHSVRSLPWPRTKGRKTANQC